MTKIKEFFGMLYFNGGIGLVISILLLAPLYTAEEHYFKTGNVVPFCVVLVLFSVIFIPEVISSFHARHHRVNKAFTIRRVLGGYLINQSLSSDCECLGKVFTKGFDEGLENLPAGTYLCYTHNAVIKRIEKYARTSNRDVEITKKIPYKVSKLALVKRQVSRLEVCKSCCNKERCPFLNPPKSVQMYGVEFKIR